MFTHAEYNATSSRLRTVYLAPSSHASLAANFTRSGHGVSGNHPPSRCVVANPDIAGRAHDPVVAYGHRWRRDTVDRNGTIGVPQELPNGTDESTLPAMGP